MRHVASVLLLTAAASVAGCAKHHAPPSDGTVSSVEAPMRRRSDLITIDEIQSKQWLTVYEMIAELRPLWFSDHGPDTMNSIPTVLQVHLNGARYGDINSLHQMPTANITYVEYFGPNDAAARWGLNYNHGAINVSTLRR